MKKLGLLALLALLLSACAQPGGPTTSHPSAWDGASWDSATWQ